MTGAESNSPIKNKVPVAEKEDNSDDQGKERKTTANQSDICQNRLVCWWDVSRGLEGKMHVNIL